MKKLIFSTVLLVAVFTGAKAQQDPAYSMYMFNGLFLNPAYAGSSEAISVMAIYRHQHNHQHGHQYDYRIAALDQKH